jgi:hypothetical protein
LGFTPPADHAGKYDILDVSVGTDPNLALKTRRGTGYYKVPSLKGVWYRGPFEHSGYRRVNTTWLSAAEHPRVLLPSRKVNPPTSVPAIV